MNNQKYDVIVIGGGPAGLTASIYTARAHLKTLVIAGSPPGGQLMWTTEVENFPGFPEGILGPALISNMRDQSQKFGTQFIDDTVKAISGDFHSESGFEITLSSNDEVFSSKAIIVATGASARWLGLDSEQRLIGKGISACATCDGFFFREKDIIVVGAGDAAMEEATFLTKFADSVTVLVRGSKEEMRASKIMQDRAFSNNKISFMFNTEVAEVLGSDSVEGVVVINNKTNEEHTLTNIKGVFVAIGHKPNTDFLEGFIELGKFGYIKVTDNTKTSKEGVFVAGDVADYRYRQAITASGLGCMAALDVEKMLAHKD